MSLLARWLRSLRSGGGEARRAASAAAGAPPGALSARLPYRGDLAGFRCVSENTLAALSGESVEALHRLELFDEEGQPVQVVEERSRRPFVCLTPGPGGPSLGSLRVSLQVDPERLGPEAAALLRQLPSPGRACLQLRRGASAPWESVREGEGVELDLPGDRPLRLDVLNPAAQPVVVTITHRGGAGALPASLALPAGGVRSLLVPALAGTLQLRAPQAPRSAPRPQVLLEPLELGDPWCSLEL